MNQGKLVKWVNSEGRQIIWMMTDNRGEGVVIHSDNLLSVGTTTNLANFETEPFIGIVHVKSE